MPLANEKILIAGPAWVGDMVMAQSLFRLLIDRSPDAIIDVVAPPWSVPLLARMPEVRRGIALSIGHGELKLSERYRVGQSLRQEKYSSAIIMPRSLKAALVPFFAKIPLRTGYRGELRYGLLNDVRRLDKSVLDQTVKRFIALGLPRDAPLSAAPSPRLQIDVAKRDALAARFGLSGKTLVALMPGAAYGPAKCWPIEYFRELTSRLEAEGWGVIVLGSAGEKPVGERICAGGGATVVNLCGQTQLEETVDLLSLAKVAVTNDSGLMHVAAAAGTHVVAIYGSSSPEFTPPLTPASQQTVLRLGLECSPCFKRECPLEHLRCLRDIKPDQVLASVAAVVR